MCAEKTEIMCLSFKYEFKNLCKSGQYHYSCAKVLFVDQFLDLLKIYGYVYITEPSKCREVMMNNIWPEREQVIKRSTLIRKLIQQST